MIDYALLEAYSDFVGIIGMILTLAAYYFTSIDKWLASSFTYVWCNLIGSMMLMYSLCFHWNLASAMIEFAWIIISVNGLYRALKARRERRLKE